MDGIQSIYIYIFFPNIRGSKMASDFLGVVSSSLNVTTQFLEPRTFLGFSRSSLDTQCIPVPSIPPPPRGPPPTSTVATPPPFAKVLRPTHFLWDS